LSRLETGFYFMRGVSRAIRRGDLFPKAGRVAALAAPLGSEVLEPGSGGLNELSQLEVTRHRIRLAGLEKPIRILHLTDIHLRELDDWTERLCAKLKELTPDLVVLTGDVLTRGWKDRAVHAFLKACPKAPLGTFAVMGNWEYWGGAPEAFWESRLAEHGVVLLNNRSVQTGPLQIAGTDDFLSGAPDLEAAFKEVKPGIPLIVLTHSPALFPALVEKLQGREALVLAGHTHGGQVRFPGVGPFFLPKGSGKYPWGWYQQEKSWMFVSRGLGWSVGPWRWRAPPEIAWVELVP
jgi:predicted MPP superfamily phosphohydrolase